MGTPYVATGAVLYPFFSFMTFLNAVPTGITFSNWVGTPPRHNVTEAPRIRFERPAFELPYPHMVEWMRREAHVGRAHGPSDCDVTRIDGIEVRN